MFIRIYQYTSKNRFGFFETNFKAVQSFQMLIEILRILKKTDSFDCKTLMIYE